MNFIELQDEISLLVDSGTSSLEDMIPDLINEAVLSIANEPGVILPNLKSVQSVLTDVGKSYVNIPDFMDSKILFASVGGIQLSPYNTLEDLMSEYPDMSEVGSVEGIALEGSTLWYVKSPSVGTSILLLMYANPDILQDDYDEPICIPAHLHRQTIIPYVAKYLFDFLEQGDEGNKVNTQVQQLQYDKGLIKLREYLAARRRGMSKSIWNI
jgi:hypothetical protein